jgi:PAS domain S-box-containing protein
MMNFIPKILAIDPINGNLNSLKVIIQEAFPGAILYYAKNGPEVIELAMAINPDVILLDIVMPGVDGIEVCRLLKSDERVNVIPVVFLTELKGDKRDRIKALEVGADGFLTKPIDETELTTQIKAMIKIKAANEQNSHEKERMERMVNERTMALQNDLNEKILALELLHESEFFFEESQRAANIGSYKFDLNAGFWTSSEVLEQIFGIDKTFKRNLSGWLEIVHPDDREMMAKYFSEEVVGLRRPFNKEYRIIRQPDGETRWVLGLGKLGFDHQDQVVSMMGTIQDITERKRAEESLREINQFNNSLLKIIPFGMDIVDEDGNILFQSVGFEKVFGESAIGCKCWDLYRDDKVQCNECPLKRGIKLGESKVYESSGVLGGRVFEISHTGMMFRGKKAILEIFQDITERKRAEEELRKSYDMLNKLTAQVPGVVYQYRLYPDGRSAFPYSSPGMYEIYEVTPEEVREDASPVFTRIHPDDYNYIVETITESAKNQTLYHSEFRVILPKQGLRWRLCDSKPELMDDGSTLWYGIITDITERKLAEQRLKESQQLFQELFNASPDSILLIDPHDPKTPWSIVDCNVAACKMNGYTREELIGQSIDFLNTTVSTSETRESYLKDLKEKGILHTESFHRHKSGYVFPLEVSTSVVNIGERELVLGIDRDISDRKQAESDLREREVQYRNLADSGTALIWTSGKDKLCNYFNQPWLNFTGRTLEQELGNGWVEGVHPDDVDRCIQTYISSFDKQVPFEMEYRLRHVSGEYRWLQDMGTPNYNSEGDFLGYIGHCFDISDRKKIEFELTKAKEKAEESDRLKSAFLANMSHEIRTPLNSIIGFSELMTDPDFNADQHIMFAQMINSSGTNLLAILSDIMDLSKIEAGQIQINVNRFSVNQLISDIQREYSFAAHEKGVELKLAPGSDSISTYLESDQNRIKQVLVNFVGNSIKFTSKGYIEIGFAIVDGFVQFHVIDTGIGIPKDFHEYIFERFRQVDSSFTRKYGGNGLGLAISKSLVELLGGKIWMESEPGTGSAFYFTIPV